MSEHKNWFKWFQHNRWQFNHRVSSGECLFSWVIIVIANMKAKTKVLNLCEQFHYCMQNEPKIKTVEEIYSITYLPDLLGSKGCDTASLKYKHFSENQSTTHPICFLYCSIHSSGLSLHMSHSTENNAQTNVLPL